MKRLASVRARGSSAIIGLSRLVAPVFPCTHLYMHPQTIWRYARRLSRMGLRELRVRGLQEAGKRGDALLHRLGVDPFRAGASDCDARGRFFCDPADVPRIADAMRRRMPEEADRIVASAGRILERRFDLLGYRDLDFGFDIDWSLDPVHAVRAPLIPWPSIRFLDFAVVGDHKVIWELNRHQHLVTLAKA